MQNKLLLRAAAVLLLLPAAIFTGCKDAGMEPPVSDQNVQLSVQAAGSVLHKTSHETLHITGVKVLLNRIVFSRATSDDSSDVHTGSIVVDLNLDAKMTTMTVTHVRPGVYDHVHFSLHKPEDNEVLEDSVFRQGPSGNQRFSVVITGYYHETPFTFTSRESAHQELVLVPPVTVPENGGNVNVTIKVDPYAWFTVDGLVLDPFNQDKQIDDRIKGSFASAFKDNDHNGEPD